MLFFLCLFVDPSGCPLRVSAFVLFREVRAPPGSAPPDLAAAAAFLGAGRQVRVAGGKMISADAADQGIDDIAVDAGMIANLAAHHLTRGVFSRLTPLYLADPRLGPKKKASAC